MGAASDDTATDSCPAAARAALETNARFMSCLLNEGLLQCDPAVRPDMPTAMAEPGIRLRSPKRGGVESDQELWISTTRQQHGARELWHQADFGTPILARSPGGRESDGWVTVSSPVELAGRARKLMSEAVDDTAWAGAVDQLDSSFRNMTAWIRWGDDRPSPSLTSRSIQWEQAVIVGHPVHPMGRSLVAACGLPQMLASDAPMLSQPSISFLAVDRSEVWIVGDFRKILSGLVMQFRTSAPAANEVVFPCLTRQISAILAHYGSARVVCQDAFVAAAQASLRTVTIPDRWGFPYHLKFSLSYTISSVLRAITPHSACSGPEVSHIVEDCMTADSWVCKEVAAITGSHADRTAARQITCIVREDHEARAQALGQSLIIVAALGESPTRSSECLAALTFGLGNPAAKLAWLKGYAARLIPAVCVPAIESGVGLEAHGQNTLVRVDNATRAVLGFCFRDFGSVRCHTPTLRRRGFRISTAPPDTWLLTESEEEVWDQIQHTAIHNNLQLLVRQLAVDPALAWRLIRDELDDFFSSAAACLGNETAARMHAYLTRPIVKAKALLRMRMSQVTDEDLYIDVPNVLYIHPGAQRPPRPTRDFATA